MTIPSETFLSHLVLLLAESEAKRLANMEEPRSRFDSPDTGAWEPAQDADIIPGANSRYSQLCLTQVDKRDIKTSSN